MKILITAGPTREKIDPVRFITNHSTGKMGYAIADAAIESGHDVILISGPVSIAPPQQAKVINVVSASDMAAAVHEYAPEADVIIMSAAVADYRPAHPQDHKIKKTPGNLTLELERTEDILASLGSVKKDGQLLIGFAAETNDLEGNALKKLQRKNLDWIAANLASDGFASDTNKIVLFSRTGEKIPLPAGKKLDVARDMLKKILS